MATPSQVDALIDDAQLGRVDTEAAVTQMHRVGTVMVAAGQRMLAEAARARAGLAATRGALLELRRLRPSVQGRRNARKKPRDRDAA